MNNIGRLKLAAGDPEGALRDLSTAAAMFDEDGTLAESGVLGNLALAIHAQGDYLAAIRYLTSDIDSCQQHGNTVGELQSIRCLSAIARQHGFTTLVRLDPLQ